MNIILIGMRGSGKTTVGRLLAQKLQKKFIETDGLIVKRIGLSVSEIVVKFGWDKFRDIESEVIREISESEDVIIATGGGVILNKNNIAVLKKNGQLIWFSANIKELIRKIGADKDRPFLTNSKSRKQDMEKTYQQRKKLYKAAADYIIQTDDKRPSVITKEIIKIIETL